MKLRQIYRAVAVIQADGACKITWKTVKNSRLNWRLNHNFKNTQSNFLLILLITFEVLNQTSPNLQENFTIMSLITFEVLNQSSPNLRGSCRSTSRWWLKIYMENGWKLTSELTSKWITFKNTRSNFTLISLITFEVINETPPN